MELNWLTLCALIGALVAGLTTLKTGLSAIEFLVERLQRYTQQAKQMRAPAARESMSDDARELHNALGRLLGELDAEKITADTQDHPRTDGHSKFFLAVALWCLTRAKNVKAAGAWSGSPITLAKVILSCLVSFIFLMLSVILIALSAPREAPQPISPPPQLRSTAPDPAEHFFEPAEENDDIYAKTQPDMLDLSLDGCPNGRCESTEDCQSCSQDCGICDVGIVGKSDCNPYLERESICKLRAPCMACLNVDAQGRGVCRAPLDKLSRSELLTTIQWASSSHDRCRARDNSIIIPVIDMVMHLITDETLTNNEGSLSLDSVKRAIGRPSASGYNIEGLEVRVQGGAANEACWGGLSDVVWPQRAAEHTPPTCCIGSGCSGTDYSCSTDAAEGLFRTCIAL